MGGCNTNSSLLLSSLLLCAIFSFAGRSTEGPSSTEQIQQLELMNGDNVESDKSENGKDGLHYAGIYACVVLPSLVVGTVGGGTSLATQKECLAMMGCYGKVCNHSAAALRMYCYIASPNSPPPSLME